MKLAAAQEPISIAEIKKQLSSMEDEGEVFVSMGRAQSINWSQGKPQRASEKNQVGSAARVIHNGKLGMAAKAGFSADLLLSLVDRAKADSLVKNHPFDGSLASSGQFKETSLTPPVADISLDEKLAILSDLEKEVLAVDPRIRSLIRADWTQNVDSTLLCSNRNFEGVKRGTSTSFLVEILAEANGDSQVAWDYVYAKKTTPKQIREKALACAARAVEQLGAQSLDTQKIPLLISPSVGTQILTLFAKALSGEEVAKNRSFLKDFLSKPLGSDKWTLEDDGTLPNGIQTAPFDDEGHPQKKKVLIEKGILKSFIHSAESARLLKTTPTGNGFRDAWSSFPTARPTNLFLKPGKEDRLTLLRQPGDTLEVKEILGLHMADPISGEFSFGVSGVLWRDGKKRFSVRGVTWPGDLRGLMNSVNDIAHDLTWFGNVGAPSILTYPLPVSGR